MSLTNLADEEVVSRLEGICVEGRRLLARLLVHLIEVDERRLHLKAACASLFDFCVRRLGMSEGAAFRRITAARLVRRFPGLLAWIERGELHLSALVLLRDHLTEANVEELAAAASGTSKRELQELLARRAPKPDVPPTIRKLPAPAPQAAPLETTSVLRPPSPPPAQARIEPLAPARYRVQLTASTELRDKLERARDLMRHRNPSGDLAVVVERALDALLEKLEKETQGKTARPRREPRAAQPDHIKHSVRREVFERDGAQCTFEDGQGRRCPSRAFLELDHHMSSRARSADRTRRRISGSSVGRTTCCTRRKCSDATTSHAASTCANASAVTAPQRLRRFRTRRCQRNPTRSSLGSDWSSRAADS